MRQLPAVATAGPRVLLIEPHRGMRETVAELLHSDGMAVLAVADGTTAVGMVSDWWPTVAVVEPYHQPFEGDGGLIAALHAAVPRLPVVVHTAMFPPRVQPRPEQFGAVQVVSKGCAPGELLAAVARWHAAFCGLLPAEVSR